MLNRKYSRCYVFVINLNAYSYVLDNKNRMKAIIIYVNQSITTSVRLLNTSNLFNIAMRFTCVIIYRILLYRQL